MTLTFEPLTDNFRSSQYLFGVLRFLSNSKNIIPRKNIVTRGVTLQKYFPRDDIFTVTHKHMCYLYTILVELGYKQY
jgi:hypothetical protein